MELPRFTIRDSDHKAVHEAYVRPLEKREAELSAALRDALASFKCTQCPADYAHDHWSSRATALLANESKLMDAATITPRLQPERPGGVLMQRRVRVLRLNLKGCYFDAIRNGTKPKEYRLAEKWEKRIRNGCYRVGVDEILLLRGYPKRGDESRMMRRIWNGYTIEVIQHDHFGPRPVRVLGIDVTKHPNDPISATRPTEDSK